MEAAHGEHPRKRYSAQLSGFMNTEYIAKIKQNKRGVPACMLESSTVDTLTPAIVLLLLRSDGCGEMFIEMKICHEVFTVVRHFVILVLTFTVRCESKLLYLIRHVCKCAAILELGQLCHLFFLTSLEMIFSA